MTSEDLDFISSLAKTEIPNKILRVGNENWFDIGAVRIGWTKVQTDLYSEKSRLGTTGSLKQVSATIE